MNNCVIYQVQSRMRKLRPARPRNYRFAFVMRQSALAREKNCENFSTTTSFISPYAFVKHDYKTKQQESRPYIV